MKARLSLALGTAALLIAGALLAADPASTFAPVTSRLSALIFEDLSATAVPAVTPTKAPESRLGSILLAQAPPIPGQNPNTIRPTIPPRNFNRAGSAAPRTSARIPPPAGPTPTPAATPAGSPVTQPPPDAPAPPAEPPVGEATDENGEVEFTYVGVPMGDILRLYEDLTGLRVIKDINVETVTYTLETSGKLPKDKAIDFMVKSLLLNGYGFIPAGEGFVKFMNLAQIKPGPERPLVYSFESLPQDGESVVTFIQPLQYIEAEDLKKSLTDLVPLHAYGVISPLPNARGIAITENSNTIRYIVELLKHLDVEPSKTAQRSFIIQRAKVEDVAEALADILDLESKGKGKSGGGSSGGSSGGGTAGIPNIPQPNAGIPNQPGLQPGAGAPRTSGVYGSAPQAASTPAKIVPIPRTNSLMVIARPVELEYIASLIDELDAAAQIRNFTSRPLRYMDATAVLEILETAINSLSEEGEGAGGEKTSGGLNANKQQQPQQNQNALSGSGFGNQFGGGQFGGQGGLGGGLGGGMGLSGGATTQPLRESDSPQSVSIGKTLLIADPTQNSIYVSGPPEHLETVNQILDTLDVRPKEVVINAVLATVNLANNRDFGINWIFQPQEVRIGKNTGNIGGVAGTTTADLTSLTKLGSEALTKVAPGLALLGTMNDQVSVAINALATDSNAKILSRPTLHTLNNVPATISTGTAVPVPSSSINSYNGIGGGTGGNVGGGVVSNITYQQANLSLAVTPLILNDDEIKLVINQQNNTLNGSTEINGSKIPNINQQSLSTTVLVKDKQTVLLGGLIDEKEDRSRSGIPVLRDIPLLKHLFSSANKGTGRNELLIFISPRIVHTAEDAPVTAADSAGASELGKAAQEFFTSERNDPKGDAKRVKRTKLGQLLERLFR